jgi:16S rRNA (uracil1498-N3)-methyltransferase
MRIPRCHVDMALAENAGVTLPETAARHLRQVLRMRPDDAVTLFNDRDGKDYRAVLLSLSKQAVKARIVSAGAVEAAPILDIHLAIGISKGTRMDFALQKAVELGVTSVTPLITERTVVRLSDERMARRMSHWQGIIIHACEQSGRRWLPILDSVMQLDDWLEQNRVPGLLLDHKADKCLPDVHKPENGVCILIGPEGGLSNQEKQLAGTKDMTGIRLGPRVMRTETAPLAAIAAIQVCWGDFRP